MAVDTQSPSNVNCEQAFSAMNNIITHIRNMITTNNTEKQLFVNTVDLRAKNGIQSQMAWTWTWLGLGKEKVQITQKVARVVET